MPWFVWLLTAGVLGAAEFFTLTLVFGLLAGAALVAAVVAGVGIGVLGQLVAFGVAAAGVSSSSVLSRCGIWHSNPSPARAVMR